MWFPKTYFTGVSSLTVIPHCSRNTLEMNKSDLDLFPAAGTLKIISGPLLDFRNVPLGFVFTLIPEFIHEESSFIFPAVISFKLVSSLRDELKIHSIDLCYRRKYM